MDIDSLTVAEYLETEDRARRNGGAVSELRYIQRELRARPTARERLALEFLVTALRYLEEGTDPWNLVVFGICFGIGMRESKLPEFLGRLRDIILRSFELIGGSKTEVDWRRLQFEPTLALSLIGFRRLDEVQYLTIVEALKAKCDPQDPRREIVAQSEESVATKNERIRQLITEAKLGDVLTWRLGDSSSN